MKSSYSFHFHLAFASLFLLVSSSSSANIKTDEEALLALKAHITTDHQHILTTNWSAGTPPCAWIGVTCGARHGRVIAVDIPNMNLTGTIAPHIGNLSFLASLNMTNNTFHGQIPPELNLLRRLRVLALGTNNLTGDFPPWIGSLTRLTTLALQYNDITGEIPASISNISNLETLSIHFNYMGGSVPREVYNVSSLKLFSLTGNGGFSGTIPDDICDKLPGLSFLGLAKNKFSGGIPGSIVRCYQLKALSISFNQLTGAIPKGIWRLKKLEAVESSDNRFTGEIPRDIGNATGVTRLYLSTNLLRGPIPEEMSSLSKLQNLDLGFNGFTGLVPPAIYNLSTLTLLSLAGNQFHGTLPPDMGSGLPHLQLIYLNTNSFSGPIPHTLSNSSKLEILELSENHFSGPIPDSIGNLRLLTLIQLTQNNLHSSTDLTLITALANSRYLTSFSVANNPLNVALPPSIGNLSSSLLKFYAYGCGLTGKIPPEIGNLSTMFQLSLYNNQLTGSLPSAVQNLHKLQMINLSRNKLSLAPLDYFCGLDKLGVLQLQRNQITGTVPKCLGNVTALRYLYLTSNNFSSSLPEEIWNLKELLDINVGSNSFEGSLSPHVKNLKTAWRINFSRNRFSGAIPVTFGELTDLNYLFLAYNQLQGSIPSSIGTMLSLKTLDLSSNNLSGSIPKSLQKLWFLSRLNLSFNNLNGEIPSSGPFQNLTAASFISNLALCGAARFSVPPCPANTNSPGKLKQVIKFILIALAVALVVATLSAVSYLQCQKRRRKDLIEPGLPLSVTTERISYYQLQKATNGYDASNLLGAGSFGSVYKGTLDDGRVVAVKLFNSEIEGSFKSFDLECEALCNLRHRNITKVISCCSNLEFKALVLEFMPNGSLDKWLYSHNHCLDIIQRLDILIDVASALEYLHLGYSSPVVHCDLKPSNVLLDEHMVARVTDFGIVKLLSMDGDSITFTRTLATLCYLAPEYGLEGLVSTKCDVYSFGIMMMEVITRMNPRNEMFGDDFSIRNWVNDHITPPNALAHIVDANMLSPTDEHFLEKMDCVSSIIRISLNCTMESPRDRIIIKDALSGMKKIKSQLLLCYRQN